MINFTVMFFTSISSAIHILETSFVLMLMVISYKLKHAFLPQLVIFFYGWILLKCYLLFWNRWIHLKSLLYYVKMEKKSINTDVDKKRDRIEEFYSNMGIQGALLKNVTETILQDDCKVLATLLVKQTNFNKYNHPLKEALSALGSILFALIPPLLLGYLFGIYLLCATSLSISLLAMCWIYYKEKISLLQPMYWSIATILAIFYTTYLLQEILP